jgi:hypothetical protein
MKIRIDFVSHKKSDGWYALLLPTPVIGHFNDCYEFGIFWLLWAVGFHIEK